MSRNNRSEEILRLVNMRGSIGIGELSELTYASRSTVRRELEVLEQRGLLRRRHGGAESVLSENPPRTIRSQRNREEKSAIAARASALVAPHSTVFLDSSTTVQYMIPHLSGIEGLTVYTNSVEAALSLARLHVRAICTGGEIYAESMAYVGAVAADAIRRVNFDAMFFSSAGFDSDYVSDFSESETVLRRIAMEQSTRRYFLADTTKRGRRFTHVVCRISDLDLVITEKNEN